MNYICILAHGSSRDVVECVKSVYRTTSLPFEMTILLQAAAPEVHEALAEVIDGRTELHTSWQNLMAIGGRLRLTDLLRRQLERDDVVTWLDDDVTCTFQGWDELLSDAARTYGIGTQVAVDVRADWTDFEEPPDLGRQPGLYDVAGGGMTCMRAEYIMRGAEYDQSFAPFWHADADFSLQCRSMGAKVWGCRVGFEHEYNHKGAHDFYWKRNFLKLRRKWEGWGLIKTEAQSS